MKEDKIKYKIEQMADELPAYELEDLITILEGLYSSKIEEEGEAGELLKL